MHPTRNDLSAKTRTAVRAVFAPLLLDAVDLFTQIKQAHWNVKGPNFIALHELFDTIAEASEEWGDEIAERVMQLGGTALGTARIVAKGTTLPEYPAKAVRGHEHVEAMSAALAAFGKRVRAAIDECATLGDADSADICTEISRAVDKQLWFVESHSRRFA
jgi:starvation-inducible DNA-binding protein